MMNSYLTLSGRKIEATNFGQVESYIRTTKSDVLKEVIKEISAPFSYDRVHQDGIQHYLHLWFPDHVHWVDIPRFPFVLLLGLTLLHFEIAICQCVGTKLSLRGFTWSQNNYIDFYRILKCRHFRISLPSNSPLILGFTHLLSNIF